MTCPIHNVLLTLSILLLAWSATRTRHTMAFDTRKPWGKYIMYVTVLVFWCNTTSQCMLRSRIGTSPQPAGLPLWVLACYVVARRCGRRANDNTKPASHDIGIDHKYKGKLDCEDNLRGASDVHQRSECDTYGLLFPPMLPKLHTIDSFSAQPTTAHDDRPFSKRLGQP